MNDEVLNFIHTFTANGTRREVIETFTSGCCWWFATILHIRFPNSEIYYDQIDNHFAVKIGDGIYDITGECSNKYPMMQSWADLSDSLLRARIARDCILFQNDNFIAGGE